jgi:hypothetical protein
MTEGGTLGVDRETAVISLSYPVALPLDPPDMFQDIAVKLVNAAEFWIRKFQGISADYKQPGEISDFSSSFIRV